MKIISGIIGLVILFYICFLPVYLFFYNSSEDAVEQLSLYSNTENFIKIESEYGKNIPARRAKKMLNELDSDKEKYLKRGIDISKPLYKILKENKDVTDLKIVDVNKEEFGIIGSLANLQNGAELFVIRCKIQNHKFELPVVVIPPSFFGVRRAIAWTEYDNILGAFYTK